MAAPTKRHGFLTSEGISVNPVKKIKLSGELDQKLFKFLSWCNAGSLTLNSKVVVRKEGSCAHYGMIATDSIDAGEVLFEIPRSMILSSENCGIADLLKKDAESIRSKSGWVPLLLALLYEASCSESKWRPYLDLVPDCEELDLPMFWTRHELEKNLNGTGVVEAVTRDLDNITSEFNNVAVPFMRRHSHLFPSSCFDVEAYKRAVAFVMAYSFTEPSNQREDSDSSDDESDNGAAGGVNPPPMMVPMADILNHVARNNARLGFGAESLTMVATKPIESGEEVFNTYGELANWQLLHMYGFSEEPEQNHYDAMELSMDKVFKVIVAGVSDADRQLVVDKWQFLKEIDVVTDDGAYVLGVDGFLTDEEMFHTLKVVVMNRSEFEEHREKEGWSEADDEGHEESSESLSFGDIAKLPTSWKTILRRIAEEFLKSSSTVVTTDDSGGNATTSRRLRYSQYVKLGQQRLLNRLLESST